MDVWQFILDQLQQNSKVALLYVIDSKGSSPGRQGFVMAVSETGIFKGTIGGGIMEVKLIELAKHQLKKGDDTPIIKEQFHDKSHQQYQSGLICSGSQIVALIPLKLKDISTIHTILNRTDQLRLVVDPRNGLTVWQGKQKDVNETVKEEHQYYLTLPRPKTIHIFGAGHVGLALARQMLLLGYTIIQYDDRPQIIATLSKQISWPLQLVDYGQSDQTLTTAPSDVIVIVSFSYRSDKTILRQLYKKSVRYIGMMGSDHKIATLKKELQTAGIAEREIAHVFAPIGLNIYSKTAEEIAVSIAGQIIRETNKHLPTGRSYK